VGSHLVELTSEVFDQDLRIDSVLKPLHAQALVPELAVERLVHSVQPGFSGIDIRSVDVGLRQPSQDRSRDELRPVVTAQISRCSVHAHELGEHFDDPAGADTSCHIDRQTLARVLIDDRQAFQLLAIGAGDLPGVLRTS